MIKNNRGIVFITALAVMVILLTLATGYLFISRTQLDIGSNQGDALKAFYISQAGIEMAIRELISDSSWQTGFNNVSFGGGSYTVTRSGNEVTSVGIYNNASRTIVAGLGISYNSDFDYASYAGSDIAFNAGTSGNIKNGSVHGNDSVDLGGVNLDPGYSETTGSSAIPTADFGAYKTAALTANPAQVISGNKTFTNTAAPAGNPDYTGLWYIGGNVTINSDVRINGTIITTGKIDMKGAGNITVTPTDNYPALMAEKEIQLNANTGGGADIGNITITGMIYTESDLNLNNADNFTLNNGAIVVHKDIKANNNTSGLDITYSSALNPPNFTIGGTSTSLSSSVSGVTSWKGHPD